MAIETHKWEQIDELASQFEERFGYEPTWFGSVDEVYAKLEESLKTGTPTLMKQDPEVWH